MIIIDDSYLELPKYRRGRKSKKTFVKNDKEYIFKYDLTNFEVYAELIAEQIGKQMDIDMAHYLLAEYNGTIGVLTPNFLKAEDKIMSIDYFKDFVEKMSLENNVVLNIKEHSVFNIINAASVFDASIDASNLFLSLAKRWVFYGLIMESDKNPTNIAFIKRGAKIILSPDYDNSSMARLNENIDLFLDSLKSGATDIYHYTDHIKQALTMFNNGSENFLEEFKIFCEKYSYEACEIMKSLLKVDIEDAISEVEHLNKCSIPWSVRYWIKKVIVARFNDIKNIYVHTVKKIDEKELGYKQ